MSTQAYTFTIHGYFAAKSLTVFPTMTLCSSGFYDSGHLTACFVLPESLYF